MLRRFAVIGVLLFFIFSTLMLPPAQAAVEPETNALPPTGTTALPPTGTIALPAVGSRVALSPSFEPVLMKGLKVHPENPFTFEFVLSQGDNKSPEAQEAVGGHIKNEANRLIKYFLAALTIPEKNLWVNLSPYEKDRMIEADLGQTEMGRDLLAQDYVLKQITASLIYPEDSLGRSFWDKVYAKAQERFGTTEIPVNTFNKVWIVAERADIVERDNTAFIVGAHLKVMLDEDYRALDKNKVPLTDLPVANKNVGASEVIREIVLPELQREVNQGKNFAPLRQMFYSMILASWYKQALKQVILNQAYANQSKVANLSTENKVLTPQRIYEQYVQAYKKGVFNYIKEDLDNATRTVVPKKYFSGGFDMAMLGKNVIHRISQIPVGAKLPTDVVIAHVDTLPQTNDPAMMGYFRKFLASVRSNPVPSINGIDSKTIAINGNVSLKDKRILIVDDNEVTRKLYVDWFTRQGARVVQANDGDNGFQAYLNGAFELVVSDLMMTRVNGDVFYKNVKRINPNARIFIWTSTPNSPLAKTAQKEGVLLFSKSEPVTDIIAKVWQLMPDKAMINPSPIQDLKIAQQWITLTDGSRISRINAVKVIKLLLSQEHLDIFGKRSDSAPMIGYYGFNEAVRLGLEQDLRKMLNVINERFGLIYQGRSVYSRDEGSVVNIFGGKLLADDLSADQLIKQLQLKQQEIKQWLKRQQRLLNADLSDDTAMMTTGFLPAQKQEYIRRALEFFDQLSAQEKFPDLARDMLLIYLMGDPITEVAVRFMKEHHLQKPFDYARLMALYGLDAKGYEHFKIDPGSMLDTPDGTYTIFSRPISRTKFQAIAAHATELYTRYAFLDSESSDYIKTDSNGTQVSDSEISQEEVLDKIIREYGIFYIEVHQGFPQDVDELDANMTAFELARRKLPLLRIAQRLKAKDLNELETLKPLLFAIEHELHMHTNEAFIRQMIHPTVMKDIFENTKKELFQRRYIKSMNERQAVLNDALKVKREQLLASMYHFSRLEFTLPESNADKAMLNPGGIDLDSQQMQININKQGDSPKVVLDNDLLTKLKQDGFKALDFNITRFESVDNLSAFLGLN